MKVYQTNEIKNIALIGSAGSGKTTLAEAMLFEAGIIKRRGITQDILPDTATDLEKSLNVKNGVSYNLTDTVTESAYDGITDFSNYIIATVGIEGTTSYSKVRIYMWLEGNDLDCVNQVSGTNITFDLHLTSVNLLGGN